MWAVRRPVARQRTFSALQRAKRRSSYAPKHLGAFEAWPRRRPGTRSRCHPPRTESGARQAAPWRLNTSAISGPGQDTRDASSRKRGFDVQAFKRIGILSRGPQGGALSRRWRSRPARLSSLAGRRTGRRCRSGRHAARTMPVTSRLGRDARQRRRDGRAGEPGSDRDQDEKSRESGRSQGGDRRCAEGRPNAPNYRGLAVLRFEASSEALPAHSGFGHRCFMLDLYKMRRLAVGLRGFAARGAMRQMRFYSEPVRRTGPVRLIGA